MRGVPGESIKCGGTLGEGVRCWAHPGRVSGAGHTQGVYKMRATFRESCLEPSFPDLIEATWGDLPQVRWIACSCHADTAVFSG